MAYLGSLNGYKAGDVLTPGVDFEDPSLGDHGATSDGVVRIGTVVSWADNFNTFGVWGVLERDPDLDPNPIPLARPGESPCVRFYVGDLVYGTPFPADHVFYVIVRDSAGDMLAKLVTTGAS